MDQDKIDREISLVSCVSCSFSCTADGTDEADEVIRFTCIGGL